MRDMKAKMMTKITAVVMAGAMVITLGPVGEADAAKKKPALSKSNLTVTTDGKAATLTVKKNGNKIKSTKWTSSNNKIVTVKKVSNLKATVKGVGSGDAVVKAVVKNKAGKKFNLKCKVTSEEPVSMDRSEWVSAADAPAVTDEIRTVFGKIASEVEGYTFTPVSMIATKEGEVNYYRIFCKQIPTVPGGKVTYAIVEFYVTATGEAHISQVLDSEIEAYTSGNASGWNETETPVIAKGEGEYLNKALTGFVGSNITPIGLIATNKVRGTEYCFLCECTVVVPNATPTYKLVYVSVDENGNAALGEFKDLEGGRSGTQPDTGTDRAALIGSWKYTDGGVEAIYTFNAGGKGVYTLAGEEINFTYKDNGDSVYITFSGSEQGLDYKYQINGNKLLINDAAGNTMEYVKA